MKFSVWPNSSRPWNEVKSLVTKLEQQGWDGIWYADHYMPNTDDGATVGGDFHECFTVLTALAAVTSTVRLGSLVAPTTVHHPAVLANRAATIDRVSSGRFVLGLGAGWQVNEHRAYGIELFDNKNRVDRFEEAIEIIARLLSEERVTFAGRHFSITDAPCEPKPVQSPLPLLVGTGGPRMLRLTARWASEWNTWGSPESAGAVLKKLEQACDSVGRDPASIHKTVQALVFLVEDDKKAEELRALMPADRAVIGNVGEMQDVVNRYREAGFDEVCVPDFTVGNTAEERSNTLARYFDEVAAPFR
ncbi:MAG: LLM class flavin-dependent oxidoreductase [Actinobacteria bacterium]|nr:LLM class flavin-dependent oxidoreductase [Actinomycetota bacterium]